MLRNLRKQYHLKPSPNGFYAWDIHRLIDLSQAFPVIICPIADIKELQENFWYQNGESPTCISIVNHMKLINQVSLDYPIILSAENTVMDGMHRICKAVLNGDVSIKAVKFECTPVPDFCDIEPEELPYDQ